MVYCDIGEWGLDGTAMVLPRFTYLIFKTPRTLVRNPGFFNTQV